MGSPPYGIAPVRAGIAVRAQRTALSLAVTSLLLSGCTGGLTMPTGYAPANALISTGYSETRVDPNRYTVQAQGSSSTPRARVEKIAIARAAEIGVVEKLDYFKVVATVHETRCTTAKETPKGGKTQPGQYPVVSLEVVYTKDPDGDISFRRSKEAFETLRSEIDSETISAEDAKAVEVEVRAHCSGA